MVTLLRLTLRLTLPLVLGVLVLVWALPNATFAYDMHRFERQPPHTYGTARASSAQSHGWGPLRWDVVQVGPASSVRALPPITPLQDPPIRTMRVAHGIGHYVEMPAPDGVWVRFALAATVALGLAVALLVIASRRLFVVFEWLGQVIFGQRDPRRTTVGWVPGGGSHGTGQVPPYVPYNRDWDPENRGR